MYKDRRHKSSECRTKLLCSTDIELLRKSFIETLTHDLKTPILAQIRALDLMLNGNFGEFNKEQSEMLQLTLESCQYMYEMVSTLISTYKYENEEFELNYSYFNIMQIIEEIIKKINNVVTENNIKIVIIPEIKNPIIAGDLIRIKKVIETLLFNSINMAFKNSIIKIYLVQNEDTISVKFESRGGYIQPEKLNQMFKIHTFHFEKYDKIGAGIGLYLVEKIIEKHNGTIIAKSEITQKNTLGFEIPLDTPEEIFYENCI